MMKVVVATFPEFNKAGVGEDCEAFLSSLNKVACGWREIVKGVADWKEEEDPEPWLKAMNKVSEGKRVKEKPLTLSSG
jgi:ethanolaminephosphotransferase